MAKNFIAYEKSNGNILMSINGGDDTLSVEGARKVFQINPTVRNGLAEIVEINQTDATMVKGNKQGYKYDVATSTIVKK